MIYLEEKTSNVSLLIENQFPHYVQENNQKFLQFLASYYESQENKYQPLDIAANLVDYYNISHYRPNKLVEKTTLSENLLKTATTINVANTDGFPETNGYIQINGEIIFYRSKTKTSFVDCERGTTALVLENIPKSEIFLRNSASEEHKSGSSVVNIAFAYANEFFTRIKSELAPLLPEVLDESLDVTAFIKNIKSFYSSKGSLNSHRILFKILFNDRKFNIKLKSRGSGAKFKINNFAGYIPSDPKPEIISGGVGYDNRKNNLNQLISPPVVDIFGSGTGAVDSNGTRPNSTAIIEVTDINSNGEIVDIEVVDGGEGYRGPITARVRPRNFVQDQRVYNSSGTGTGRVDYFDAFTNDLILYDVIGYFSPNEELLTDDGEKARAYISQSFITPIQSRSGLEVISETQEIEFPREYTFKTSDANYSQKKIIRCKLIDGFELQDDRFPLANTLIQDEDKLFGVKGVKIEVDNYVPLINNILEFEVSSNSDIDDIYLQPTTEITKQVTGISSSSTNVVITVDDASRFPVTNGILFINGREISYKTRSVHQFFNCVYSGTDTFDLNIKDEVISYGRYKYDIEWQSNEIVKRGDYRFYENNLYIAETDGITGSIPPTHMDGSVVDGLFELGDSDPVKWRYFGSNRYDHTFYVDYNNPVIDNPRFQLLAVPGDVVIEYGGSLHTKTKFEFARFDSPNVDSYNFTTSEISDRLSLVLGTNYNRTRQTVTDNRFPSYKSLTGFSNSYDYDEYIYIPSSGIPRWWDDIVDLSQTTLSAEDQKKIAFTNQKLICRWKKSGLIYDTQAIGEKRKTKKLLGLNLDAIQVNSYKGNTVEYGFINKFFIGVGGDYPVPYKEVNGVATEVDYEKNPEFVLTDNGNSITVTNQSRLTKISGSIKKVNFDLLSSLWASNQNLSGFTSKPSIQVLNQNPIILVPFIDYTGIDPALNVVTRQNHGLQTSDKVTFRSNGEYFNNLISGTEYYIRKINNNEFTVHRTKSDSLLNTNPVSLSYKTIIVNGTVVPAITPDNDFEFRFETEVLNPIDYRTAILDVSYKNGNIDNILIRDSGSGYIQLPKIIITGGGKTSDIEVPLSINGDRIVDLSGPLVSYTNYYRSNFTEIDGFTQIPVSFNSSPKVTINNGTGAKAVAYTSNGTIVSMVLIDKGNSYSIPPRVVITGNGTDAVIESIINSTGEVIGFDIINGGTGYTTTPRIDIETVGGGSVISSRLNEWTFNLARQLKKYNRIDSYGGYVYDDSDAIPTVDNPKGFQLINYDLDFPKDLDKKQYFLITNSDKLLAKYTEEKNSIAVEFLKQSILQSNPSRNFGTEPLTESEIFSIPTHSPAIIVSYDGIPVYGGKKVLRERNKSIVIDPTDPRFITQWTEIKSRYKLKYTEVSSTTDGAIALSTTDGTKYVTLNRFGGPSISEYPIGTFIEDYEYVEGDDNDLDQHNGRFSITPEFPNGRYCYFTTTSSFDPITNALVASAAADNDSIGFNGFPYFIGDTFASEYDDFMNSKCRTNDKIPKIYNRSFEKDIDPAPLIGFGGIPHNDEYPQEKTNTFKTIANTSSVSGGTVDSIIIESKGDGYRVGDRLDIDNTLTSGSGFTAFVSKVGGKTITEITNTSDYKTVTFKTNQRPNLKIGDYIYFDYSNTNTVIQVNLHGNVDSAPLDNRLRVLDSVEVSIQEGFSIDTYKDKQLYSINLNFRYVYQLNIAANSEFKLTYDIDAINEFFTLEESPSNSVILTAKNIPNRLYLHVNNYIYELNKTTDFYGTHRVFSIDDQNNKFTVKFPETTFLYERSNLIYSVKSYGASGSIEDISISNPGYNYKKLPTIRGIIKKGTENEIAGDGKAIIQANSNTIGAITNVSYASIGEAFTSNKNVNYYLNIPSTAKIINNFEIYDVEVVNGGQLYDNVVQILVNGSSDLAVLRATVNIGTITSVEVINGGAYFSEIPTLTVVSQEGSGAVLKAKIRRKKLYPDAILKGTSDTREILSKLYPVQVESSVVNFDDNTSTLEFNEHIGQFKDNDVIYTFDGKPYGKILSIRRSKAYAKVNSYAKLQPEKIDISGNTSESLQKITDSNYYQDWSYSIVSSRDTIEWRKDQDINTHPAGFKQFGKKVIERRKSFFDNPADVFKSSVIFTTNIVNTVDLSVKLSPCRVQKIFFQDPSIFSIGDYIYGTTSGAVGEVINKTEYFVELKIRNNINFVVDEVVISITPEYAFGVLTGTSKSLAFWNGVFQEPGESYDISVADPAYTNIPETFVPKFTLDNSDQVVVYKTTTDFDNLDTQILSAGSSIFSLSVAGTGYTVSPSNLEEFIISIGGSVQNPNNLTVTSGLINLNEALTHESRVFAVHHNNLRKLTFNGSGSTYTIDYTPPSDCNLIIFHEGAFQTELITDFTLTGNTIIFDESVNINNIFGWYMDETVDCELINANNINSNKALSIVPCVTKNFTESIESNTVKTLNSFYEIRKETIDGTVYPTSATTITGFDTKFTYTSPRHSSSYVEVLDRIEFNGSSKTFELRTNGELYTPVNGRESLVVYVNNTVLDQSEYSTSGSSITFVQTYSASQKCTVIDYVSAFLSNTNNQKGALLDRLNVVQNGTRKTFNLSDRGVPKYVNNVGDVFTIKNGKLQIPLNNYIDHRNITLSSHDINDNKITFVNAPLSTDDVKLTFFNRQLLPEPTKNVVLDRLNCFDGVRTSFPITVDGILFAPVTVNHLFVIRNGVLQKPGIDYTLSGGHNLVFSSAPEDWEIVFSFYSYDGLNQNLVLDSFNRFDGVTTDFSLTYNFVSSYLDNDSDIMVYRNGVYQHPNTYTVLNKQSGPYIRFYDAPQENDDIFVVNYNPSNTDDLVNITGRFSQINASTLSYTNSSPSVDYDVFIIYVNGIMQSHDSFMFDSQSNTLTLSYSIDLLSDDFQVFAFANKKKILDDITAVQLDSFKKFDSSQTSFALTKDYKKTIVHNTESIQVFKNGVYQQPYIDYTTDTSFNDKFIIGPNDSTYIDFTFAPDAGDDCYILNSTTDVIRDITSEFIQVTSTSIQFSGNIIVDETVFLIFVDNLLKSSEEWTYNQLTKTITFDEEVSLSSDKVTIIAYTTPGKLLDSFNIVQIDSFKFFNSINTRFPLTKNFYHDEVSNEISLHVFRNGVYQYPFKDYSLGGGVESRFIEFTTAPNQDEKVFILNYKTSDIVDISANFRANGPSSELQYTDISVSKPTDLILFIDGVYQKPGTSYSTSGSNLTLSEVGQNLGSAVYLYQLGDNYQLSVLDDLVGFNSSTTLFALEKNSSPVTVLSDINIHVFRNGVYQYPSINYTLQNNLNEYFIDFATAPDAGEEVFILHYETDDIVDITSNFSGVGPTSTLQYTPASGVDTDLFIIYINGIPQPNWSYNDQTQVLTLGDSIDLNVDSVKIYGFKTKKITLQPFVIEDQKLTYQLIDTSDQASGVDTSTFLIFINGVPQYNYMYDDQNTVLLLGENIDLTVDDVKIFGFVTPKSMLDQFTIQSGVLSYQIEENSVPVSVSNPTDLIIFIDGVYQEPEESYTVSGSTVTFNDIDHNIGSTVYILNLGDSYNVIKLDDIDDNFTKNVFKLRYNFGEYTIYDDSDLLIYKNGTKLIPSVDFVAETTKITFTSPLVRTDDILIKVKNYKLQVAGVTITNNLPTDDTELIVSVSGLIQKPTVVYTVSGDTITINDPYVITGTRYHMFQVGAEYEELDYIDDNFSKKSFKLLSNFVYYDVNTSGNIYVYKNGDLLEDIVDYTYSDGIITFTDFITDQDSITIGIDSFNLLDNGVLISTDLPNADEDVLVHYDGVVQNPTVSYTVNGSFITFDKTYELVLYNPVQNSYSFDTMRLYQVGGSGVDIQKMDYLDDNYSKPTYKLSDNYKSFNPPSVDDILIIRNGVVQNPTEDFIAGNGFITFTTNIDETDDIFIMYTHGAEELSIVSSSAVSSSVEKYTLSNALASSEYNDIIVYADGAPRFYQRNDFTIQNNGTEIHLSHTDGITPTQVFVMKYPSVVVIDEYEDCPDGVRTRFKLLYDNQNLVIGNTVTDADILISVNGIVQHPGTQYTLTANRGFVDMSYAPQSTDEIFMVRMTDNLVRDLTPTGQTRQYTLSVAEPNEKENIVIFSNNTWKFAELGDFTWDNDSTITLSTAHTTGNLFAIKFYGVFNLLDQIHTPFNGVNTKFNLFDLEENFVPVGTVDDDDTPDETSLLVVKNGKVLDPKVDYTLSGDIESQIVFVNAPVSSDIISVRTVGSFDKLDTITNSSGDIFNITKGSIDYYPNGHIDRPRELENQIMVIVDGNVQSPLYDYFVYNNLLVFENTISFAKMVILDFRGTSSDVHVSNRFNQVSVGDEIKLVAEDEPRKVTQVLSPTVLKTEVYTGIGPSGFAASTSIANGKIDEITVTSQGINYRDPIILRTIGTGTGAKAVGLTNPYIGGGLESGEILYYGHNVYNTHYVFPTVYAYVEKKQPLSKSQIRKGTKLTSNIDSTVETIPLANTFELPSNTPVVLVSSSSGSGASFKVYISSGELRKIDILDGGSGYDDRDIELKLTGGGGTGCVLEPVLDGSGTITDVIIRNPGVGYDTFRVIIHNVDNNNIVNAEIIEYTYVSPAGIDGCTRGVLGDAASHLQDDIVYFDSYL